MRLATLVAVSSNVTFAEALERAVASATCTAFTPHTRERVFFTMGAHSSQVALSTFRTTVFSAAPAAKGDNRKARLATAAKGRIMGFSFLISVAARGTGMRAWGTRAR